MKNDEVQNFYKNDNADIVSDEGGMKVKILNRLKRRVNRKSDDVVYGVYNNANLGIWVKLNDFLIDHGKVSLKDKSYFFHMLAVMVDAGIPLVVALKSLASRSDNGRFTRILNTIAHNTEQGKKFSEAIRRFEDVFDESEVGIVKAGEATGRLDDMLFKLSKKLDSRYELNMKLWGAAVYPIVVFGVLILVASIMLVWVFPTLLGLFSDEGVGLGQLPFATRMLVWIQTALVGYWWLVLTVILSVYGIFTAYKSTDYGRNNWDSRILNMPIFGGLIRKLYVLRFVDMLGLLIDAGVPLIKVLEIIGNSFKNRAYKIVLEEVIENVKLGKKISDSLEDFPLLFPSEVMQMIRTGEASASIGKVSDKVAVQYQKEIDNSIKRLTSVFEPVLIVIVGLFVALLAMAIMGPIFNLSNTLG